MSTRFLDDIERQHLDETKAYLECRLRGMAPAPSLAEPWDRFYRSYGPRLRELLRKWRLSDADREDCLQDVWVEVVVHLGHFQHDPRRARLSTWLSTLARHKAADSCRRRSRHPSRPFREGDFVTLVDPMSGPEADCDRRWVQSQVGVVLAELADQVPEASFRVLYLRSIEGRKVAEVAAALGLTPEQVRMRTHRMKRRLRDLLERFAVKEDFDSERS